VALVIFAEQLTRQARDSHAALPPPITWVLFASGAALLVAAVWPVSQLSIANVGRYFVGRSADRRLQRSIRPLLVASICLVVSVQLFRTVNSVALGQVPPEPANSGSWLFWIGALVFFSWAVLAWERAVPITADGDEATSSRERPAFKIELLIMIALFCWALLVRLINLDKVPPGLWFDEAESGLVAERLSVLGGAHPTFVSGFTHMGSFYFYVLGGVIKIFGPSIWSLRALPALSGALLSPLLYLLGSRLYSWRVGLAAAAMVAISTWNITFSRLGMNTMPTVLLDVAALLCVVRGLQTGRSWYFAAGGLALGLALQMYQTSRLLAVVLLLLVLHLLITTRGQVVRRAGAGLAVFALATVFAFAPVGVFAIQHPAVFSERVDQVSVFNTALQGREAEVLGANLSKHLLMFSFKGDRNGRHNLPDAPMLDDLTAAMFFLGLGSCVWRAWRWQYFLPLAWFIVALAAGVLTLPFEAPQAARTVENSVVTALLAGLAIGEVSHVLERLWASRRWTSWIATAARLGVPTALSVSYLGILVFLVPAASSTLPRYFIRQAGSAAVWGDMTAAQAEAGRYLSRRQRDEEVVVSPSFIGGPTLRFLAPASAPQEWPGMAAIPIQMSRKADVTLLLDPRDGVDLSAVSRIYPHATTDRLRAPSGGEPLLFTVRLPAEDIQKTHGVSASLYDPGATQPREERTQRDLSFDWAGAAPSASVSLSTTLDVVDSGTYHFAWRPLETASSGTLLVDGALAGAYRGFLLGRGLHTLRATHPVTAASNADLLTWGMEGRPAEPIDPAQLFDPSRLEPHGLTGTYRAGRLPEGPTAGARVDPVISFFFHHLPLGLQRPYNVAWVGRLYAPVAGTYGFGTEQIDESRLSIDGRQAVANLLPNQLSEAQITLSAGWHDIQLEYLDASAYSHVYLYWTPPGRPRSVIPSAFLRPQMTAPPQPDGHEPTLADSQAEGLP
jgi:4-amino-4-deoxy-L-arabinose transferase-like glycosyltransferase